MERQFYKMIRVWRCRVSSVEVFGKPEVKRKTVITAKLAEQYWLKIVLQGKLEAQKTITISNFTSAHAFPVKPEIIGFKPKEGKYQVYFESNPRNQTHGVQKWDPFFSPPTHFRSKPAIIGFLPIEGKYQVSFNPIHVIRPTEFKNEIVFSAHLRISGQNQKLSVFYLKKQISSILRIKPTYWDILNSNKILFFDPPTNCQLWPGKINFLALLPQIHCFRWKFEFSDLIQSERLKKVLPTYLFERTERLKGSKRTYHLKRTQSNSSNSQSNSSNSSAADSCSIYHLDRSERLKESFSTYYLERSERLNGSLWTYLLERSERLNNCWSTYRLEWSERLKESLST